MTQKLESRLIVFLLIQRLNQFHSDSELISQCDSYSGGKLAIMKFCQRTL